MRPVDSGNRPGALRRWGPLGAVLACLVAVAVLVLVTAPTGDDTASAGGGPKVTTGTGASEELPEGVVTFASAEEDGTVDEIKWGARCDTETGNLALPNSPPPECFAPFEGDNGGATSTGVTAETVKVVVYQPQPNDSAQPMATP